MKKIGATNRIIEKTERNPMFKLMVDKSITRFRKGDFGITDQQDIENNLFATLRGYGLVIGVYKTLYGMIHVFVDGKQDKIIVAFADEVL